MREGESMNPQELDGPAGEKNKNKFKKKKLSPEPESSQRPFGYNFHYSRTSYPTRPSGV